MEFYPLKTLAAITAVTKRFYAHWDQAQYQRYLGYFGLDERKKFKELSNGMKVKYLLTLALSHHAELLILDEPTSGLDPVSRDELLHLFRQIVEGNTAPSCFPPILPRIWTSAPMTSPTCRRGRYCKARIKRRSCAPLII